MTVLEEEFPTAWWPRPSIRMSRDIGEYAAALAAAQLEMEHPNKSKENTHFRNKYADLKDVIDAVKVLNKHGIAVIGSTEDDGESVRVLLLFVHSSGQWQQGQLSVPLPAVTAQGLGSALTYGRRYLISLMCNVASDDDDDGNAASAPPAYQRREPPREKPSPLVENKPIMAAIVAALRTEAREAKLSEDAVAAAVKTVTGGRTVDLKQLWRSEVDALRDEMKKSTQPTLDSV